ncbi:type II secretion system protein [Candidatus Peregrinibacteria bacterium]|nr:type II secretion system protein [Candidatus Peregrinibacteria bacterium]
MKFFFKNSAGFTLIELLISVGLFAIVVVIFSSLLIQSIRTSQEANTQNQIYEDARFLMQHIAKEIRSGMVDYDEYYSQNVVIPSNKGNGIDNFGQNYGKYYSSFYNPGSDEKLGFECNDSSSNKQNCKPLSETKDKNTGQNPFEGKLGNEEAGKENAFCGAISYKITKKEGEIAELKTGKLPDGTDLCPAETSAKTAQHELYLISSDGRTKTIFAREKIGIDKDKNSMYALSFLRMKGEDLKNEDGVPDSFKCANGFECTDNSGADCKTGDYPSSRANELNPDDNAFNAEACDTKEWGFSKDFVPISPFRANIVGFDVYVSPSENPHYAFSENQEQYSPRVKVVLTLAPNPKYFSIQTTFKPITIARTIYAGVLNKIPAPVLVE